MGRGEIGLRILSVLDGCGHAVCYVLRLPLPLWLYLLCCARERQHDRVYPFECPCCERMPPRDGQGAST
jgi:hypothetical protein